MRIQRGSGPPPPPPGKLQNIGFLSFLAILVRIPLKSLSYQSSNQCWAIIGPPAKFHLNGVSLDPSSPHQTKKNVKVGPHLTIFLDPRMAITRENLSFVIRWNDWISQGIFHSKKQCWVHMLVFALSWTAYFRFSRCLVVFFIFYFNFDWPWFCEQTVATLFIRRRILFWVTVFMSNKQDTWLSLICHVHFLESRPHVRPQILKQHVAGIEVSGLFDLKKDHAVFAFDVNWYN